jgi:hypothetical protein
MSTQSDIVQLEALEGQYKNKLTQYESAYVTYINSLQQQNSDTRSYVVLPGKNYMGTGSISDTPDSTVSMCEASCKENPLCSGASFNSISNVCKLRSGDGALRPGATSDNAIITTIKENLMNLEKLNVQLIQINVQITELYHKMQPTIDSQNQALSTNGEELSKRYSLLQQEKLKIKKLLDEYGDVNKNIDDSTIMVEQQNSTYYLWVIICILSLYLVVKYTAFPDEKLGLIGTIGMFAIICVMVFYIMQRM